PKTNERFWGNAFLYGQRKCAERRGEGGRKAQSVHLGRIFGRRGIACGPSGEHDPCFHPKRRTRKNRCGRFIDPFKLGHRRRNRLDQRLGTSFKIKHPKKAERGFEIVKTTKTMRIK